MKELFEKCIDTIKDENLRKFAHYCVSYIPKYFWKIPASSSGKYHPVTDLGEGGLVRHSLMTYRVALDLIQQKSWEIMVPGITAREILTDVVIFSTLFHDTFKAGCIDELPEDYDTLHEHPILAKEEYTKAFNDYYNTLTEDERKKIIREDLHFKFSLIQDCISKHMGKWITSNYSDIILSEPETEIEQLVHNADYIASRKYCLYDEEFFNNL